MTSNPDVYDPAEDDARWQRRLDDPRPEGNEIVQRAQPPRYDRVPAGENRLRAELQDVLEDLDVVRRALRGDRTPDEKAALRRRLADRVSRRDQLLDWLEALADEATA